MKELRRRRRRKSYLDMDHVEREIHRELSNHHQLEP
jgi:hypothetical protein